MVPAKTFRPVSRPVVDLAPEGQRSFPGNRELADGQSTDRSADDPWLRRFLRPRSDSTHPLRGRKRFRSATPQPRLGAAIQPPRCGRSKFPFSLRKFRGKNALGLLLAKCFQSLPKFFVGGSKNRNGEKRCVFGAGISNRQSSNRNPARHLRSR